MKEDFPDAFYQLMNPAANQQTTELSITKNHFTRLFSGKFINAEETIVLLKPKEGMSIANPTSLIVDNTTACGWINVFNSEIKKATIPLGKFYPN